MLCPGLQPGPPSQTPGGLGQRYWCVSEVTWPPQMELRRWRSSGPSSAMVSNEDSISYVSRGFIAMTSHSFLNLIISILYQEFLTMRPLVISRSRNSYPKRTSMLVPTIRLEGPENPHRRNSRFLRSRFNTSGPDPLGFDWEGLAASRGTAGGHGGFPPLK